MSVSASEVNGSSGCYSVRGCLVFKVLHLVPVVLAVLVDRSKFSFFFVVFVVILVICRWVMYCSASLVVRSWSSYDSRGTCGPRDFLVPIMVLLVLRFSWFQCFSWLSWISWSVLSFLWSESSSCSTHSPRCSLCSYGLQGSYSLSWFRCDSSG